MMLSLFSSPMSRCMSEICVCARASEGEKASARARLRERERERFCDRESDFREQKVQKATEILLHADTVDT
jgi:hypothetical protein